MTEKELRAFYHRLVDMFVNKQLELPRSGGYLAPLLAKLPKDEYQALMALAGWIDAHVDEYRKKAERFASRGK